jgi:hypothetical protein
LIVSLDGDPGSRIARRGGGFGGGGGVARAAGFAFDSGLGAALAAGRLAGVRPRVAWPRPRDGFPGGLLEELTPELPDLSDRAW